MSSRKLVREVSKLFPWDEWLTMTPKQTLRTFVSGLSLSLFAYRLTPTPQPSGPMQLKNVFGLSKCKSGVGVFQNGLSKYPYIQACCWLHLRAWDVLEEG